MIVIKSTTKYAETVRRVASSLPLHRVEDITDLNEAAGILEDVAKLQANSPVVVEGGLNILEDES